MRSKEKRSQSHNMISLSTIPGPNSPKDTEFCIVEGGNLIAGINNEGVGLEAGLPPITKAQFIMLSIALCVGIFIVTLDVIILVCTPGSRLRKQLQFRQ
ncbi:hypothetical protein FQN49_002637 [Arthroderma sp. PD_2]|nr:hypothetical protein FQN49_002637 [Arthroderma sp. PD_2]